MKLKILIVDDDVQFLTFLERTLVRGGFSVITASDGSEVPDLLRDHPIDVLILDLQMPGMNGWEVLRSLRRGGAGISLQKAKKPPKVIVVSGRSEDETVSFVRRLGADAYLMKPVWGDDIVSAVRGVVEG